MQQIIFIFAITVSSIPFILVLLSILKWKKWTKILIDDEMDDEEILEEEENGKIRLKNYLVDLLKGSNLNENEISLLTNLYISNLLKYPNPFIYSDGDKNFCFEWIDGDSSIVLHFSEKFLKGSSTNFVSNEYNNYNLPWTYIVDNNESFENLLKWLFEKPKELEPHPSIIEDDLTPII